MVIVEGMDNAGKTTLVQRLSADLKLLVLNNRRRPQNKEEILDYVKLIRPLAAHFPVILDRYAPISEPIYGPICRSTRLLNPSDIEQLIATTVSMNTLVVYCRPTVETILLFKDDIPQMDGVIQHGPALIEAYDTAMEFLGNQLPVVGYNWQSDSYQDLLNTVRLHFQS